MITFTSKFLKDNWAKLMENGFLPIELYEWDDGDVYLQKDLAILPSSRIINAAIVFKPASKVSDFKFVIRAAEVKDKTPHDYQAESGSRYKFIVEHDGQKTECKVQVIELSKELSSRNALIETDLLKDCCVLIVGLGTGGIQVALELAKAGVGKFKLLDADRLEAGNVVRHCAGVSFIGRKKVFAARDLILEKNPQAIIETFPIKAENENRDLLDSLVKDCNLVVCATDNRQSKLLINSVCLNLKRTAIFGGAFRRAYGGHVIRVRPGESACFHCFVLAMPEKDTDREISSEENAQEIAYSDRPVSVEPGLSIDVAPIGIMVAKLALQELIIGKKSALHLLDKDLSANWYFWINRPEPGTEYSSLPPLSESCDEITILRWYGVELARDESCPSCGDFGKALREKFGLESTKIMPNVQQREFK